MEQLVRNKVLSYLLNNKIPLNEFHFFKVLMYGLKSSSGFFLVCFQVKLLHVLNENILSVEKLLTIFTVIQGIH